MADKNLFKRMHSKRGFTLAEALITLVIIGIVAAMTIPTLITTTTVSKYRAKFKKSVSTLSQAARYGIAEFSLDYSTATATCTPSSGETEIPDNKSSFCSLFNAVTLAHYIGPLDNTIYNIAAVTETATIEEGALVFDTNPNLYIAYEFPEGIMVGFKRNAADCTLGKEVLTLNWVERHPECIGFVDVNGLGLPNTIVNCEEKNSTVIDLSAQCAVPSDMRHLTDIYPILFHDSTVVPLTAAARSVLNFVPSTMSTDKDWVEND